jgi:hypothetical protein
MRILFVWDYERADLTHPLIQSLKEAELFFLYKYERDEQDGKHAYDIYYWNDFKTPYQVLKKINPDKIVFMEIEAFHQVALNIAAINSGIKTYRLEHGVKASYQSYASLPVPAAPANDNTKVVAKRSASGSVETLLFYLSSFRLKNAGSLIPFFRFIYTRSKHGIREGLKRCPFDLRRPQFYVDFTAYNSRFTMERDNPLPSQYIFIGNLYFDKYFNYLKEHNTEQKGDYYLLIDSGFVEDNMSRMKVKTLIEFYNKLNKYCKSKNALLKIKLHPMSYNASYLPHDTNIIYLREVNVLQEMLDSKGCFHSHFSTLTPLAMYYRPCILFEAFPDFNTDIKESNLIPVLDFYNFSPEEISFAELDDNGKAIIADRYFYLTDGKAGERLTSLLIN